MSGLTSLHKILKDETRQKIITLLNEKGSLSYSDLMENAEVLSTGLMNYHLKVLGELLQKNDGVLYMLSEKGQVAYKVLTEFSGDQPQVTDKRIYKSWIILFSSVVAITLLNDYFLNIPLERASIIFAIVLLSFGFAFYIRIRPSHAGNRAFFVAVGALGLGFVLWFLITSLVLFSGLR
jgi:DNA-binding transcriptional ArsR family regulator